MPITAKQLLERQPPDKHVELVKGVMVVKEPPGYVHGVITVRLARLLSEYVEAHQLGLVVSESGFKLASDPDTVRGPDLAFIRHDRLPDPPPSGFVALAPDLVVEVLSPTDRPGETLAKVADWIEAGTLLVWVVDPERRLARVYRLDGTEASVNLEGSLNGEEVVAGFSCPLSAVLG